MALRNLGFLCLLLTGCSSAFKLPPIPTEVVDVNEELAYIYKTDQKDRRAVLLKVLFQTEEKYMQDRKIQAVSSRDSIRLSRVMDLDQDHVLLSDQAKFYAAMVYLHEGGPGMKETKLYLKRAVSLFEYLTRNADTKGLKKKAAIYLEEATYRLEAIKD